MLSGSHVVVLGVQNNRTMQLQHHFAPTVKKTNKCGAQARKQYA